MSDVITLSNVSITHPGASTPTLRNINLAVEEGDLTLVVGRTGTGKSTLITSLIKETFVEDVQEIVPELTLPADVSPEGVTTKIVDTYRTLRPR